MNLYPHTITVYNRYRQNTGGPFAATDRYDKTVITGVAWEDETHYNTNGNGVSVMDKTISVIIPLEADTEGKTYIQPKDYANLPDDDVTHWTLTEGDLIVFGECLKETDDVQELKKDFNAVAIQTVADFTNQGILPHWEVGAK
jgi:hypothetical protein